MKIKFRHKNFFVGFVAGVKLLEQRFNRHLSPLAQKCVLIGVGSGITCFYPLFGLIGTGLYIGHRIENVMKQYFKESVSGFKITDLKQPISPLFEKIVSQKASSHLFKKPLNNPAVGRTALKRRCKN